MAKKLAHPTEGARGTEGLRLDNLTYSYNGGSPGTTHADAERFFHPSLSIEHAAPDNPNYKEIVGKLNWHGGTGEIHMVETNPKYRGLKVATHMLEHATNESTKMGVPAPHHSNIRTKSGDAWAKSTDKHVPPISSGVCRDCPTLRDTNGACHCTSGPEYFKLWG